MCMADSNGKNWKIGALLDWRDTTIPVLTPALHAGRGVFEGERARKMAQRQSISPRQEHLQRRFTSARLFQLAVPCGPVAMREAQRQVGQPNQLNACFLRPLIWFGAKMVRRAVQGNNIHLAIAAWPEGACPGEAGVRNGSRVKTSSFSRHHATVSLTRVAGSPHHGRPCASTPRPARRRNISIG